jgi:O-methyltransferase domain
MTFSSKEYISNLASDAPSRPRRFKLLIIEGVIHEDQADPRAGTLDIVMLTVTGGRERTAAAFSALLEKAHFLFDRVITTASPMWIVAARPC